MKVLMVGNCLFEHLTDPLHAKGYNTDMTYIANPATLLYSDRIPDGLADTLARLGITDRLEKRTLAYQFEGISAETTYDVVFVNYYQEQRPVLRHKTEKYLLHLNYQAIKAFEPPEVWDWISQNFDIVDTKPANYHQRFTGLILKIRQKFPDAAIIIVNKFAPVEAIGPVAEWICTEGRPFDGPYLDEMEKWINLMMEKDPALFFFHSENILIDFLKIDGFNFQFLFPEICSPSSNCTPHNYIRDLEHPSDLYYEKLSEYMARMILCHESGDREGLRRICEIKDMELWNAFVNQKFSFNPMPKAELLNLFQNSQLTCQMVGLENTIPFHPDQLDDVDSIFIHNLERSKHFIELRNNFRTVFRIKPRKSLLPALERFHEYYKYLNDSKASKNYYHANVRDFEHLLNACRNDLPEHF